MQRLLLACLLAVGLVALGHSPTLASGSVDYCLGCHTDFREGSPSPHKLHQDYVGDCQNCHQSSVFDPLSTNNSANYAEYGCNGCHVAAGIANWHVNNEYASCDQAGCHAGLASPASEAILPYYYTDGRSSVVNPCRTNAANGGEDWDGDGFGLDNDADGLYDANDPDCANIVPIDQRTWSTLKELFELE